MCTRHGFGSSSFIKIFLYFIEKTYNINVFSVDKNDQIEFFNEIENLTTDEEKIIFSKGYILFQLFYDEIETIKLALSKTEFNHVEKAILNEIHKKYGVFTNKTIIKNIYLNEKLEFVLCKFMEHLEDNIERVESSLMWEEDFRDFIDSYDPNEIYKNKLLK